MTSDDFTGLRSSFRESFYRFASDNRIELCKEWEAPMPSFVPVLVKLFDAKTNRIFTVEQYQEDLGSFDYAIRKTGLHFEQDDLLLRYKNASESLGAILEIYKKWIVEEIAADKIDEILGNERKRG